MVDAAAHATGAVGLSSGSAQPWARQALENGVKTRYGVPSPLRTVPGATAYGESVAISVAPMPSRARATASSRRRP